MMSLEPEHEKSLLRGCGECDDLKTSGVDGFRSVGFWNADPIQSDMRSKVHRATSGRSGLVRPHPKRVTPSFAESAPTALCALLDRAKRRH